MSFIAKYTRRNLLRRPGRTLLTTLGVALALFLLVSVESLSAGMNAALSGSDAARTLIVYRQNRYCPQTSFLPERYVSGIEKLPGVVSVLPVKVFLNNCRASLDLVTFQGAPVDRLFAARDVRIVEGSEQDFRNGKDSALLGRSFANRRNLSPGDKFRLGNITVNVAGVFEAADPVEESVVLTHLEFLQRSGPVNRLGTVTQFEVKLQDASMARETARRIDDLFSSAEEPTDTRPRIEFLESATRDLRELLGFGRIFGVVCALVVLVLVANTVNMSVQERRREFGVCLAVGFQGRHLLQMVIAETLLLVFVGTALGIGGAFLAVKLSGINIGVEGVSVQFLVSGAVILEGVLVALVLGLVAASIPAWIAARQDPVMALKGG
ncbi:MAG: ABC transporter permease [Planctomycetes bacterium]|nr:ABC transporter permease [Planctomycetota bacterium]